jgi:hypothetical protein
VQHVTAQASRTHTVVVDWDGTAVPQAWPAQPKEFMPGFVDNMRRLHEVGFRITIFSARYNPYDPYTSQPLPPGIPAAEVAYIRDMLDRHGLTYIDIWTKPGKPSGSVYVDDKAERYNGCKKCWDRVTDKILIRLGKEEAAFPAFRQEEAPTD